MFVGRISEQKELSEAIKRPGSLSIVYGNRRVGKTALINKVCGESRMEYISFECLRSSMRDNVDRLGAQLASITTLGFNLHFDTFLDLFRYADSLGRRMVFSIDEYPFLYSQNDRAYIDSLFQAIVDSHLSNISIVISGSHVGMMKALLSEGGPLFGRTEIVIHLEELNYLEASEFCPELTPYQKVAFYSVFGGSPFILQQLDYSKSVEENIKETFLRNTSSISFFVSEGYTADMAMRDSANRVLEALGNSSMRHNDIENRLGLEHNGLLSKTLKSLTDMGFIDKVAPINRPNDKKKAPYRIKNNALRFYFAYLYGKANLLSILGPEAFYDANIKDTLTSFIAKRFEDIARSYFSLATKAGLLKGIYDIGTYYYDDPINRKNGEFDVALEKADGYWIYEVKYLREKMGAAMIAKEVAQIKAIEEIDVKGIGFISINGFESTDYPYVLIDGATLYSLIGNNNI